jgi:hypothetical protein
MKTRCTSSCTLCTIFTQEITEIIVTFHIYIYIYIYIYILYTMQNIGEIAQRLTERPMPVGVIYLSSARHPQLFWGPPNCYPTSTGSKLAGCKAGNFISHILF